ncbi:TAFII55 protein conserved region-domain-containing protein [Chaetomium fimeti]|uniref:TAFII55 protein conserved region-domain-containing protein n=1 Tax=Chaetomium fimeti TaxID=1854472 RepID=A0AAE0HSP6_9PEZI|nr:TAFII55 protein conserved region-domain-containing protein [Chaetomium fimeti]
METTQKPPGPKKLPSLKITNRATPAGGGAMITPNTSFQQSTSPTPPTPSQGPSKIRLVTKSQPSTPAESRPPSLSSRPTANGLDTISAVPKITQTKTGRISKPSAKKRTREVSDDDEDRPLRNGTTPHQSKKTKITLKPTTPGLVRQPTLKVKPVGRIPQKPLGEGYDSEAEDREVDPVIEEQFLFRMLPGEPSEYLRTAIQNKQIGLPKSQGGADFQVKWLDDEGRRAVVTVKGQLYAAILLDLPSITEGMKTWDKKAMVKSSDICQMLMAFAQVQSEEEAKTAPLPKAVEHGHRWPHGITPPMHDARNRRFRKRLSKLEIKNKEAEVDRLLASDREALTVRTEWIDNNKDGTGNEEEEEEYEEDAEGEADDYFGDGTMGQLPEEEEEFEVDDAALEAEFLEAVETPLVETPGLGVDAATPGTIAAPTPAPQAEEEAGDAEEEESDEEDEEDGDEDEDEDDGDEDEAAAATRNVIANLKKQLKMYEVQLAASVQPIMRKRLEGNIRNVKAEILLKKSSIGETEED